MSFSFLILKMFWLCNRWILANKEKLKDPSRAEFDRLPADFVCFRGLLVALMSTLYDNNNDWEVWAIKLRGTIYLCAKETLAKQVSQYIKRVWYLTIIYPRCELHF